MLRFVGVFLAVVVVFYALTLWPWADANILYPVMKASACGASLLLNLVGVKTAVQGVVIRSPDYAVAVLRGCDPLEPMVLFAAGVLAFPAAWPRRLLGLLIGCLLLFFLNLVRVGSLFLLGAHGSPLLDSFHLCWWPVFFIVCSLVLWVFWLRWVQLAIPGPRAGPRAPLPVGGL